MKFEIIKKQDSLQGRYCARIQTSTDNLRQLLVKSSQMKTWLQLYQAHVVQDFHFSGFFFKKYHLVEFKFESILVGKGINSYFCFENSNFDHALCI
jgi:hypothetical protein